MPAYAVALATIKIIQVNKTKRLAKQTNAECDIRQGNTQTE